MSADIVVLVPRDGLSDSDRAGLRARAIDIVEGDLARVVVADDRLIGVQTAEGAVVALNALFVPPQFVPNSNLLSALGCELDAHRWAIKDATGRTTVPGIWVAGNVANPRAQVITAAGEGSAAAIAVNADLVEEDLRNACALGSGRASAPPVGRLTGPTSR